MERSILVVEDDAAQRRHLARILAAAGHGVSEAPGGAAALERLTGAGRDPGIALVLLDLAMPDLDGIAVLKRLRAAEVAVPVVVLTSDGSVARAVEAMRAGATDFLVKPVGPERLDVSIRNALAISALSSEVRRLSRRAENRLGFDELIAASPAMQHAIRTARRAAQSDIPLLILGESGTGKEVFARAVHGEGPRAGGPFVAVNCGALPAHLVESILFGHEKGAFTGATARREGKFQEASGGTLFLDEIGELPAEAQVKLLRALQTGEIDPVGAASPVQVDIRLVSATNRDLEAEVRAGRFREDLYYRIGVLPLTLPPLRERRADIPGLARMFLSRCVAAEGAAIEDFSQAALEAMRTAEWPGNVRQLENAIYRAVVLSDGPRIEPADLRLAPGPAGPAAGAAPGEAGRTGPPTTDAEGHVRRIIDVERDMIAYALERYAGAMSEIARRLGIGRSTLYRKIDDFQLGRRGG